MTYSGLQHWNIYVGIKTRFVREKKHGYIDVGVKLRLIRERQYESRSIYSGSSLDENTSSRGLQYGNINVCVKLRLIRKGQSEILYL